MTTVSDYQSTFDGAECTIRHRMHVTYIRESEQFITANRDDFRTGDPYLRILFVCVQWVRLHQRLGGGVVADWLCPHPRSIVWWALVQLCWLEVPR